jgi:hypothetical protein
MQCLYVDREKKSGKKMAHQQQESDGPLMQGDTPAVVAAIASAAGAAAAAGAGEVDSGVSHPQQTW